MVISHVSLLNSSIETQYRQKTEGTNRLQNYTCRGRKIDSDETCFCGETDSSVEVSSCGRDVKERMDDGEDRDSDMETGFLMGSGAADDLGSEKRMTW